MKRVTKFFLSLGMLVFSSTEGFALGCQDIPGAVVDPDLRVLSTNFGRLLPDRKNLKENRQQLETLALERLVATRLQSKDGGSIADVVFLSDGTTSISGKIDGKDFAQTSKTQIAGLSKIVETEKVSSELAKIGQSIETFVLPEISSNLDLASLSAGADKIMAAQHVQTIKGLPETVTETVVQYSCTRNAEYAGDPADLSTMVVLKGVVKATTVSKTTTIARSLDISITDIATLQSVSRNDFLAALAPLTGIADLLKAAEVAKSENQSVPVVEKSTQATASDEIANPQPAAQMDFLSKAIRFFSLEKPGTWILLLVAALVSALIIILSGKKSKAPTSVRDKVEPKQGLSKEQQVTPEQRQDTIVEALQEQVTSLKSEKEKTGKDLKELREENLKLKTRLDKAETEVRDLSAQVIELQTTSGLMENSRDADKQAVVELEKGNQRLVGANDGYREKINELEGEHTALMHKLVLREDAIAQAETLNNQMQGMNDEINHAFTREQTARSELEAEFDRMSQDYSTLWSQSSDRVAHFRKETAGQKADVRELRDELLSLAAELETVRKDRDELNREFNVLGLESARMNHEHEISISALEGKIKTLHLDLAIYKGLLEENQVSIPQMRRLPTTVGQRPRDLQAWQEGREEALGQPEGTGDNVVPLARRSGDNND